MPNGGHISCEYCTNNERGVCQIFGTATSPFVLCRSFRMQPGMSWEEAVQQWPMLAVLAPGAVYRIDNSSLSAGDPRPVFGLRRVTPHPIPDSYWVIPGRLLAGEYPGAPRDGEARHKIRRLLAEGIGFFLDLTEETEPLNPYSRLLAEEAAGLGVAAEHHRMPLRDLGTPAKPVMKQILDAIDSALREGHSIYVHCWGGIGRTGTVVGCHMVRHGMKGRDALAEIARLRQDTPDGWKRSPETDAQRRFVGRWIEE